MVDTFHPLHVTKAAMDLDDELSVFTGCRPRTPPGEAAELSERGPEAFPDWRLFAAAVTDSGWEVPHPLVAGRWSRRARRTAPGRS